MWRHTENKLRRHGSDEIDPMPFIQTNRNDAHFAPNRRRRSDHLEILKLMNISVQSFILHYRQKPITLKLNHGPVPDFQSIENNRRFWVVNTWHAIDHITFILLIWFESRFAVAFNPQADNKEHYEKHT